MMAVVALQPLVTTLEKRACTSLVRTFPGLRFLDEAVVEVEVAVEVQVDRACRRGPPTGTPPLRR